MTPILYEKDEIDFTSQGLGSLVEIYDVDVAEQRNGLLQLTASYPVTGVRYDDISVGRIILAKPNQRDESHAFRITSTDLDIMGHNVMIEADSITYDLNHNIVKHLSVSGADGQTMMSALKNAIVNPSIFNFYSDITHVSSTSLDYVNPMEAVMGVKGSFLQIWGGELKRENRRVAMFNRRGRDNVATFRLGKNISGLKYNVDISSLVTRILPIKSVQENDTTTYLEGTPVSSQYINSYEQIYTIKVDFTDDTIKTVDDLNKASANWFVDSANTARDKPSVTIDIDVLSLQDSADYQDKFKDLESVALTDTVTVYVPEYGINVTAIVNELHFDPIQERVTKLTVGTAKQSFADSSRTQLSDLQDKIISVQNQADAAAVSANGKNKNYSGSVEPSHPQEGDLWYWKNGDLSGIKQFINGEWVDLVDSNTQQQIAAGVTDAVTQANAHTDEVKQGLVSDIATAKSQAASQANTAQQNAIDVASKSLGTYLVRLLPVTNIFKTTNSTTIQAQVWKAGQDITSTLDNVSFSWKIAKDGAAAISLTNNVKTITAKPSDFNNTGTYIVNVIIPVTDTTGTTRNQTFSDSTTIAKVADGVNGANGNGISKTTITYQLGTSATTDPTGAWTSTVPTLVKGQYLWTRTVWTYTDGTSETGYTTSYIAKDGNNGNDGIAGKDGVGITSTTITYAGSTSGTVAPTTGYTSAVPTVAAGNFLWTKTVWNYSDNTTETGYSVAKMGEKGTDGKDGIAGKDGKDGADGKNGSDGAPGPKGADGRTSYIHVAYANSSNGATNFSTTDPTGRAYIGAYTDFTLNDSTNYLDYTWSLIKGTDGRDGANGLPGPKGVDGISTYVHFAYANSSNGTTNFSVTDPTGRAYVGTLTDTVVADSTDPTKYTWSLIKGADGNGISSTTITYATSASGTIAPTSGYTSTIPTVNKGQFLWQRTVTSYTNGTTKNSDVVTYFAKDGVNGIDGLDGGQGMIAQPSKPTSGLVDGFLWLDTSQTYPVYYIYDSSIKDFKIYQFNAKNINADQIKAKFVGTNRLSASQIIADDLHVKSANIDGQMTASQITVSSTNGAQTSLANFNLGEMSQTISDTKNAVNNLGKVNQLFNTEFSPDLQGWSMNGSGTYTTGDYDYSGAVLVLANTGGGIVTLYSSPISLNGSSSITISWKLNYYIFSVGTNGSSYIYLQYLDSSLNPIPNVFIYPQNVAGSSGKGWTNYIVNNYTLTNMPTGAKYIRLVVDARENGSKIGINKPMLVFAPTVGTYVQGNYNNNAALTQVKTTADSISNFVRDSSGNLSSNFQTALSKTSIITGSTLASSIQKQTSSQIASALTDNNGKIISLINQDSSGVQIAGKNIVLNGDTTVTGAFKVSQANIANGAIGTAQIGDAAITNAKIADLDVSKITGNVTNFIQSNWNGVYESTTITNDGMQIVTSDITTSFGPRGIKLTQGGESVGGIGVSSYVDMPTNFQGIAFNLDGTGDYMTWSARDSGVTTGDYTTKLAWFRSSYKPIGQNAGFNFSSDSPVTFWGDIYGRENTEPLKIANFGMKGVSAGGLGHGNGSSAITFGGDGEIYIVSGGKYYKLAQFVKALQPLIGLGTWSAPKNINSNGVVTQWTNVTT